MAGQTITKPRGDKTQRYVLYLGVLLAAIAAIVAFVAISNADGGGGDNVPVVQAKEAIPADTRITSDMLEVKFVSPDKVDADAFTSRSQLIDRVVTENVAAGAQMLTTEVSEVAGDGLAFKVKPGMRGVSVEVREVVIAGGNIKPGDKVDIVGIFEVGSVEAANHLLAQLGANQTVAEPKLAAAGPDEAPVVDNFVLTVTLLQNIKMLGLAQTLTPSTAGGTFAEQVEEADTEPGAGTATLQVSPAKAQMLTTADEYGILRMDARAVSDKATAEVAPTLVVVDRAQ